MVLLKKIRHYRYLTTCNIYLCLILIYNLYLKCFRVYMQSIYAQRLNAKIIELSVAKMWLDAIQEWDIADCEEDEDAGSECVCGKENLRYLYTVKNIRNNNTLYPIGSSCIKKFNRADLNEKITTQEKMFRLFKAIRSGEHIKLTPEFFSRRVLEFFYNNNAFVASRYNNYNGYNDYNFMLTMFNKRDKGNITEGQHRKIRGIIVGSLRPYLTRVLTNKVKNMHSQ